MYSNNAHNRRYHGSYESKAESPTHKSNRTWQRRLNLFYISWRFNSIFRSILILFVTAAFVAFYLIAIRKSSDQQLINGDYLSVDLAGQSLKDRPNVRHHISTTAKQPFLDFGDPKVIETLESTKSHIVSSRPRIHQPHHLNDLRKLTEDIKPSSSSPTITAIIYVNGLSDVRDLGASIQSLKAQIIRPKFIWILATIAHHAAVKTAVSKWAGAADGVELFVVDGSKISIMSKARQATTDLIFLLNKALVPGKRYLQNILQIASIDEYADTLIGTSGIELALSENAPKKFLQSDNSKTNLLRCYGDHGGGVIIVKTSKRIDYLTNAWLLKKSWIESIMRDAEKSVENIPLGFWISFALQNNNNIPTILIPTEKDKNMWVDSRWLTSLQNECRLTQGNILQRTEMSKYIHRGFVSAQQASMFETQDSHVSNIAFILSDGRDARYMTSLVCKMALNDDFFVHVITLGNQPSLTYETYMSWVQHNFENCPIAFYDLQIGNVDMDSTDTFSTHTIAHKIDGLLQRLVAKVVFHATDGKITVRRAVEIVNVGRGTGSPLPTVIGMPAEDFQHAHWVADLHIDSIMNWHIPVFEMSIITNNRPISLARTVESAMNMVMFGDRGYMIISVEQTADKETREYVNRLQWVNGTVHKRARIRKGGLVSAVTESWFPADDHHYGLLLEDDIEVSRYSYAWIKYNTLKYRYGPDKKYARRMYGIALYNQRTLELWLTGRRPFVAEDSLGGSKFPIRSPYLHQTPCSWGAVYFPEHWREFHAYINTRLTSLDTNTHFDVKIPGAKSNRWKSSWKRFFIELAYFRAYVMLYPNYENFTSFSTNHFETGSHVSDKKKQKSIAKFEVPLMKEDILLEGIPGKRLKSFMELPVLDFWGRLTSWTSLLQRGLKLQAEYSSCKAPSQNAILNLPEDDDGEDARDAKTIMVLESEVTYRADDLLCIPQAKLEHVQLAVDINNDEITTAFSNIVGKPNVKYLLDEQASKDAKLKLPDLPIMPLDEGKLGIDIDENHQSPSDDLSIEAQANLSQILKGDITIKDTTELDAIVHNDPVIIRKTQDESNSGQRPVLLQAYDEQD